MWHRNDEWFSQETTCDSLKPQKKPESQFKKKLLQSEIERKTGRVLRQSDGITR